ncbi:hypothetical protein [Streptomyces sp. SAS_270]|uniref:hypothetical protein n=1 Tax=Streptomyces sp. SAS_270 TaxID=3412748 RepID=UPI00403D4D69
MRYAVVRDTAMCNAVPFDPARPGPARQRPRPSRGQHPPSPPPPRVAAVPALTVLLVPRREQQTEEPGAPEA